MKKGTTQNPRTVKAVQTKSQQEQVLQFVNSVHKKGATKLIESADDKNKSAIELSLSELNREFKVYLGSISEPNYPRYEKDINFLDKRLLIYLLMVSNLVSSKFDLRHKEEQGLDFTVQGFPVDSHNADYKSWMTFVRFSAERFQRHDAKLDLRAWTGDECSLGMQVGSAAEDIARLRINTHLQDRQPLPREVLPLVSSIEKMRAYGETLKKEAPTKAEAATSLADELLSKLHAYFELEAGMRQQNKDDFIREFHQTLHSKDEMMSKHRKYWAVVLKNILTAATGVGFLGLGLYYVVTGQGFFSTTKSMQRVAAVDEALKISFSEV